MKNKDKSHNLLPKHVAIIMDGNWRWSHKNKTNFVEGYHRGIEVAKTIIKFSLMKKIKYLTLYAFSSENWNRPSLWVDQIIQLLKHYLNQEAENFLKNQIRLKFIGDYNKNLSSDIINLIKDIEHKTSTNELLKLQIAFNYGGRSEILEAIRKLTQEVINNKMSPELITINHFESKLYTSGIPDPDLLIRTGGECRLSNFLLWQLAYSEFVFFDCLWPDFNEFFFQKALYLFSKRNRRFGTFPDENYK